MFWSELIFRNGRQTCLCLKSLLRIIMKKTYRKNSKEYICETIIIYIFKCAINSIFSVPDWIEVAFMYLEIAHFCNYLIKIIQHIKHR